MRHTDRDRFHMDFLVHTSQVGAYDQEARAMGSRIIACAPTGLRRPWSYVRYPRQLLSILKEHGPYDIVHGHLQESSGYFLRAAAQAGVKVRIAHSHNSDPPPPWQAGRIRRAYNKVLTGWIDRYATLGLACSRSAAQSLYGEHWESNRRRQILHLGIDPALFSEQVDPACERLRWGIPVDAPVIGHVGRFVPQKNHAFLLEVIAACLRLRPEVHFLLVGDGPLRPAIQKAVDDRGLSKRVILTGARSDVPRLMLSAMDAFVFPSLWEGLGIVLLEAQAAGLPVLVSENVPDEFAVLPQQIERLPLGDGPEHWARRMLLRLDLPKPGREAALAALRRSGFTIDRSARALQEVYTNCFSES
jgi:glycosyltransferase involved in cell wall biosynthesis